MDENQMEGEEIIEEHAAIVFKMNRKQAQMVMRYIKDHLSDTEMIFAVDVETEELILQAKSADPDDMILLEGEEDVFEIETMDEDVEEETV